MLPGHQQSDYDIEQHVALPSVAMALTEPRMWGIRMIRIPAGLGGFNHPKQTACLIVYHNQNAGDYW